MMFAKQRSFFSALLAAALTFALSFSGAIFDSPIGSAQSASAITPCPTGWTFITANGPYKNYCYNQITTAGAETFTVPQGVVAVDVVAVGGGGGGGGAAYDGCCGNDAWGGAGGAGGSLTGTMPVTGGQVVGFYPGGKGATGGQNSTVNAAGGVSTFSAAYNGGNGKGGPGGLSGAGGAGGAATLITLDSDIKAVIAGGGGGGGAGYCQAWGTGATAHVAYAGNTAGETATASGGGWQGNGGGGGAGAVAGAAGGLSGNVGYCGYVSTRRGLGGAAGSNSSTFGTPTTHGSSVEGYINAYFSPLPVAEVTLVAESTPPVANSWTYRVEFAPDVTGLDNSDFTMLENGVAATGWTFSGLAGGPSIWTVAASKTGLANGTNISLRVDHSGVQTVVLSLVGTGTAQAANFAVDTLPPTASSVTITPDLAVNKKVHVDILFSEPIYAVDATQILIGSSGVWTKSGATLSGSTYSFDVTYATLVNADLTVAVGNTTATDMAGNVQTVGRTFFEQVDLVEPAAVYADTAPRLASASTTKALSLSFTRPVWGLTTSDFSWPATNGASCSTTSISPTSGPATNYTVNITCTGSGTSTLRLAASAVKDFAAVAGPAVALDLPIIRDTTAPTISAISSKVVGSRVDYTVTFSEELSQFPASAISTAGATTASGTGTWTATTPVRVGATNQWTFSVSNADAVNGVYKPSFTVGGNVKDISGNSLTVDPTIANATIVRLPTFATGTLATPSSNATALAPNFELSLYGGKMHGIKITNLDWSTSGTTKDAFSASLSSGNMGGSVTTNTSNGTIEILAPNATEVQWETAIRSIQFDAGSNSGARRFEFHLRPISGYMYGSEHYLVLSSATSLLPAAITAAADSTYAGLRGYLATIASAEENTWSLTIGTAAWISGSDAAVEGSWVHTAGPEEGQTMSPTYWDNSPQQPDNAAEDCLIIYASAGYDGWHDVMCNLSQYYITEFGGMAGDPSVPSMKTTVSTTIDAIGPDVTTVRSTTANGTYIVGETISLQATLDEATVVAGGTPRIKLNTSPTPRYATYTSGSGTTTLNFSYTIQAGDTSGDLNYFDTASLELNGATLKDAAGNNANITLDATNASSSLAAASAIVIDADLFIAPTFSLGTLPGIGPNPTAIAPNFNLTTRGAQPFGVLITNNSFDAAASVLDAFVLNPVPAGVTVVANGSGEIELYGTTLTEAQWEAAIRAIQFDAGSSGATPNLTFHLRPYQAYDYETGHAYLQVADSSKSAAGAKAAAAAFSLAGFPGYLATPTSANETAVLVSSGMTRNGTTIHVALEKQAYGSSLVKTIAPGSSTTNINYTNWNTGEPNLAGDMAVHIYGDGKWNDYNG
ncbi:MAG: hypothetical protein RIS66_931, partial [Actinomycetota bacterium]